MNIQLINIENLKPAEYNPRKDLQPEDEEWRKIQRSIEEFGYVDPIIVNSDMTVIGGHQRLKVLKDLGYTEIECNVVDLDKTREKALNLALNKINGEWDNQKLEELLAELKSLDFDLDITGFNPDELNEIFNDMLETTEDDFDVDKALDEIEEPITQQGDIWILGRHRLMCGDSREENNVLQLMDKEKADLILTDPPYNVDYKGTAGKIKNDNMNETEFYNFLLDAFKNLYNFAKAGASIYVFHADSLGLIFRNTFINAGFKLAQCLIWVKNTFVIGRQDYQWRHEPILYGWKQGAAHKWYGQYDKDTVIDLKEDNITNKMTKKELIEYIDKMIQEKHENSTVMYNKKPSKSIEHPTMKPINLLTILIKNSSKENDIVMDLFRWKWFDINCMRAIK